MWFGCVCRVSILQIVRKCGVCVVCARLRAICGMRELGQCACVCVRGVSVVVSSPPVFRTFVCGMSSCSAAAAVVGGVDLDACESDYRALFCDARVPSSVEDLMLRLEGGMAFKRVEVTGLDVAFSYFCAVRAARPSCELLYLATEALCDCLELSTDSNWVVRCDPDAMCWVNEPCIVEAVRVDDRRLKRSFVRLFKLLKLGHVARRMKAAGTGFIHPLMTRYLTCVSTLSTGDAEIVCGEVDEEADGEEEEEE